MFGRLDTESREYKMTQDTPSVTALPTLREKIRRACAGCRTRHVVVSQGLESIVESPDPNLLELGIAEGGLGKSFSVVQSGGGSALPILAFLAIVLLATCVCYASAERSWPWSTTVFDWFATDSNSPSPIPALFNHQRSEP